MRCGELIVLHDPKTPSLSSLIDSLVSLTTKIFLKLTTGKPFEEKLQDLRKTLTEKKSSGTVVSMLDDVAWLFNLRGSDIEYNPVFFAYAVVTHDSATLYINEKKLTKEVKDHLHGVKIAPYEDIFRDIKTLAESIDGESSKDKILVSNKCSWALTLALGENKVTLGPHYFEQLEGLTWQERIQFKMPRR